MIRYLGVWLNPILIFKTHVTKICASAMWNLQKLKLIRQYLDEETCRRLVQSLVFSHLDYANALLAGVHRGSHYSSNESKT